MLGKVMSIPRLVQAAKWVAMGGILSPFRFMQETYSGTLGKLKRMNQCICGVLNIIPFEKCIAKHVFPVAKGKLKITLKLFLPC